MTLAVPPPPLDQTPTATAIVAYDAPVDPPGMDITVSPSFHSFWWVREGWARVEGDFGSRRASVGEGLFLSPGVRRHQTFAANTRLLSLSFIVKWEDGHPLLDSHPPMSFGAAEVRDLLPLIENACRLGRTRRHSTMDWLRFQAGFHLVIEKLLPWLTQKHSFHLLDPQEGDPRLAPIIREVRQNPVAGPLPFARWQKVAGLSRSQINRLAREQLGESLHTYRDRQLAAFLKRHLITGSSSVKELSADHGFVDSAHLCHWLKRQTGATPSELRQQEV